MSDAARPDQGREADGAPEAADRGVLFLVFEDAAGGTPVLVSALAEAGLAHRTAPRGARAPDLLAMLSAEDRQRRLVLVGAADGAARALAMAPRLPAALVVAVSPTGALRPDGAVRPLRLPLLLLADVGDDAAAAVRTLGRRAARVAIAAFGRPGVDHLAAVGALDKILRVAARTSGLRTLERLAGETRRLHRQGRRRSPAWLVRLALRAAEKGKARSFRVVTGLIASSRLGAPDVERLILAARALALPDELRRWTTVAARDHAASPLLAPHLARGTDPAVRVIHDEGRSILRFVESDPEARRPLFVTFTGFEGRRDDRPGFGEPLIRRLGCNVVAVKSADRNNFSDITLEAMAAAVRPIAERHPLVVTYGQSGGGYAALVFSGAIGADVAIAISPRNTRDPLYRMPTARIPADWRDTHGRIRDRAAPAAVKLVLYDPTDAQDERYVAAEIAGLSNLSLVRLRHSGHPSSEHLLRIGALKPLVQGLADGSLGPADVAGLGPSVVRAHRAGRAASVAYLSSLALGIGRSRRPGRRASVAALLERIDLDAVGELQLHRLCLACHAAGLKADHRRLLARARARFPDSTHLGRAPWPAPVEAVLDRLAAIAIRLGLRQPFSRRGRPDEDEG